MTTRPDLGTVLEPSGARQIGYPSLEEDRTSLPSHAGARLHVLARAHSDLFTERLLMHLFRRRKMKDYLRTTMLLMGISAPAVFAKDISVAAASDLTAALTEIKGNYESGSKNKLNLTFGSSGNFFAQIKQGAPFDVFFSADIDYPQQLAAAKLADEATVTAYAIGKLVLWVPKESPLDIEKQGLQALLDARVVKIAIANPAHAPYGRAAEQALRHTTATATALTNADASTLWDKVQSKLVMGENISQTAQFVDTGNAQVGLIALSLALSPAMKSRGRYIEIPQSSYSELVQGLCVLTTAPAKAEAMDFFQYLQTPAPKAILKRYGFTIPGK